MNHHDLEATAEHSDAELTPTPGSDLEDDASVPADPAASGNAASSSAAKHRMRRMTLNDAQKYEICIYMRDEEERAGRPTNKAVTAYIFHRYNIKVDESTVSRLKQQAKTRLSRDPANPAAKRHRQVVFPELERLLGEYVQENKKHVIITDTMILKTGKDLRVKLNIPADLIKFSDGWLNKFKIRHGLKAATVPRAPHVVDDNQNAGTSAGDRAKARARFRARARAEIRSITAKEQARQSRAPATSMELDAVEGALSPPPPPPPPSSTSMEHDEDDDHHHQPLDVDMEMSTAMDVEPSDGDQTPAVEQTARQQQHSRPSETSNHSDVRPAASASTTPTDSAVERIDLTLDSTPGTSRASPAEHLRRQSSRSKSKVSRINSAVDIHKAPRPLLPAAAAAPVPRIEPRRPPLTLAAPSRSAESSAGLGLTVTADAGALGARPGPGQPETAARASLSLRFTDPVAAGFQPEPPVDFFEASRCVDTLRIFMQQHNFRAEQVHHLRDIYVAMMNTKQKQQEQQQQNSRHHS